MISQLVCLFKEIAMKKTILIISKPPTTPNKKKKFGGSFAEN